MILYRKQRRRAVGIFIAAILDAVNVIVGVKMVHRA
jgi:hypothetical protein